MSFAGAFKPERNVHGCINVSATIVWRDLMTLIDFGRSCQ
jgi:hypothetical protein